MSLSVECWRPVGDTLSENMSSRQFTQFVNDLHDDDPMVAPFTFFLEVEYTRDGEVRRALEDRLVQTYQSPPYLDIEDGGLVKESSRRMLVWNVLPTPSLESAPARLQSLIVYVDTEVWGMSGSVLELVPFNRLFDSSSVLLLWGIRIGNTFLWRTTSLWLNDGATGELIRHRHHVEFNGEARHVIAVFRDADLLPRIAVAAGKTLSARQKAGARIDIFRERVRVVRAPAETQEQRWEISPFVTDLEKRMTECCSRGTNRF